MKEKWDNREDVEKEFPLDQWEHIPVKDPDEGRILIAQVVFTGSGCIIGEARWFGPDDGVMLIRKENIQSPETKAELPKKKWWQRLFGC